MICLNEEHYPFPETPTVLTADPRLHNYDADTPCTYVHRGGRPAGSDLKTDSFYLKALAAWVDATYPDGRYGHSVAQEILREVRSHARAAKRAGGCLLCGHCTHCKAAR